MSTALGLSLGGQPARGVCGALSPRTSRASLGSCARSELSAVRWAGRRPCPPPTPSLRAVGSLLCDIRAGSSLSLSELAPSLGRSCPGEPKQRLQRSSGEAGRLWQSRVTAMGRGSQRPNARGRPRAGLPSAERAPTVRDRGRRAADPRLCGIKNVCGLRGRLFCPERRRRKEKEEEDEEIPGPRRRRHGGRP